MEPSGSHTKPTKRRRKHAPEFKRVVFNACKQPGRSVAEVAQYYQINANLVHKWRRELRQQGALPQTDFIQLPPPVAAQSPALQPLDSRPITLELPSPKGPVIVHWPAEQIDSLAHWLRTLLA